MARAGAGRQKLARLATASAGRKLVSAGSRDRECEVGRRSAEFVIVGDEARQVSPEWLAGRQVNRIECPEPRYPVRLRPGADRAAEIDTVGVGFLVISGIAALALLWGTRSYQRARARPDGRTGRPQSSTARTAAASAAGTSPIPKCVPSATTSRPPTTTLRTSAAVAAKMTASSAAKSGSPLGRPARPGATPASLGESSPTVTRSARHPGEIPPASGQPRLE